MINNLSNFLERHIGFIAVVLGGGAIASEIAGMDNLALFTEFGLVGLLAGLIALGGFRLIGLMRQLISFGERVFKESNETRLATNQEIASNNKLLASMIESNSLIANNAVKATSTTGELLAKTNDLLSKIHGQQSENFAVSLSAHKKTQELILKAAGKIEDLDSHVMDFDVSSRDWQKNVQKALQDILDESRIHSGALSATKAEILVMLKALQSTIEAEQGENVSPCGAEAPSEKQGAMNEEAD